MVTLIFVIVVIGLLILVHEWGHFYSARKLGVKVEEFGFGFPPRIYSKIRGGVRYSFNLLPLGGFVKIFGEHGEGEGSRESFISRPGWQRFIILAAGVAMNFFLAWVFFSAGAAIGVPQITEEKNSDVPVSIVGIGPRSPAEAAGLRFGDQILELRSSEINLRVESEKDIRDFVDAYRGEEIIIVIRRGDAIREMKATPRITFPEGEGPLGIALARLALIRTPWFLAPIQGAMTLGRSVVATLQGLWLIVHDVVAQGKVSAAVSGPVGIFFFAQDIRSLGFAYFLQFAGILSVNLAIINFLPIPALDGGRILFLGIEKMKGSRVRPQVENFIHGIGFALLIALMLFVTYKDIVKLCGAYWAC